MSLITTKAYVAALKAEGCRVVAWTGWNTRDRPGPWNPRGVIVHHTGPPVDVPRMREILRFGRPDLPGPLCHGGGRPDGTIDLIGWFDTNHAGMGDANVLTAVLMGATAPPPRHGRDTVDGNANFYGLELIHDGTRTPFDPRQVDAAVRYCAAICRAHGWTANSVIYHRGWSTRKVDPSSSFPSVAAFRARVAERLRHPPGWSPGDRIDQLLKEITAMDLDAKITIPADYASAHADAAGREGKPVTITVETLLRRIYDWTYRSMMRP